MGDFGKISDITKFRNEGDKIFAFKPQPDRFLSFFYIGKKVVVTNAFRKKTQKLPEKEKYLALQRMNSYDSRVNSGDYYDE
jgi:phage-related protein